MSQTCTAPNAEDVDEASDVLVKVEHVSKKFCRSLKKSLWYGLRDIGGELNPFSSGGGRAARGDATSVSPAKPRLRPDEFWAVNDVSFELRRGECLGLVGRNGAGKTTLLKMLNGLIKPDMGRITMRGRVGALIALGAGFNPILTGRENIYVNGSVLRLTKREIDSKLEEIIDFAEIGEFIDAPVQSYSSGMQVRLGFSVATALKPDVLILDEVLAVGDFQFRMKCLDKITSLLATTSVIFVSHNSDQTRRICNLGLYMKHGSLIDVGPTLGVLNTYENDSSLLETPQSYWSDKIESVRWRGDSNHCIAFGKSLPVSLAIKANEKIDNAIVRILFYAADGQLAAEWSSGLSGNCCNLSKHQETILNFNIGPLRLRAGLYHISVIVASNDNIKYHANVKRIAVVEIVGSPNLLSYYQV